MSNSIATLGYGRINSVSVSGYAQILDDRRGKPRIQPPTGWIYWDFYTRFIVNRWNKDRFGVHFDVYLDAEHEFNTFYDVFSQKLQEFKAVIICAREGQITHYSRITAIKPAFAEHRIRLIVDKAQDIPHTIAVKTEPGVPHIELLINSSGYSKTLAKRQIHEQLEKHQARLARLTTQGIRIPTKHWLYLEQTMKLAKHIDEYGQPDTPLEIWTLHGAEDELCLQWDGTIWELNTGPLPVDDTHPNCKCTRDPIELGF